MLIDAGADQTVERNRWGTLMTACDFAIESAFLF